MVNQPILSAADKSNINYGTDLNLWQNKIETKI